MRGQALVEFAIITPILLLLILGSMGIGVLLLARMQLEHAAQEVAVFAAANDCAGALGRVVQVLGHEPDDKDCSVTGQTVRVTLVDSDGLLSVPMVPLPGSVSAEARAIVREEPEPSASP